MLSWISLIESKLLWDWIETGKDDGTYLADSATNNAVMLGPVDNLAHTLFKKINMRLNITLVSDQSDINHYKAYLQTFLNYNRADGNTFLVL